jgi:GTPase SAR1 family protein
MNKTLLFIVGLTGVGKSTTLKALKSSALQFELLPNRRELADTIIIPEMQRAEGKKQRVERDRLERFRLTAQYRERYPAGMVHALQQYLSKHKTTGQNLMFDNIRGLGECRAALETFSDSRFIFLDAPPMVRLKLFDVYEVAKLDTSGIEESKLIDAVHIMLTEHQHYNSSEAASFLKSQLDNIQLLYLDTSQLSIEDVTKKIQEWL